MGAGGRGPGAGVLLLALLAGAIGARAATFYVTVTGLGGEQEFTQRFDGWASDIEKALQDAPGAKLDTLHNATRDQLRAKLAAIAKQAAPQDAFVLMLIGHGTCEDDEYKLNLQGPDLTATELRTLLDRIPATRQLVVNMTSASGGSLAALRKPGRVVITATKAGTETNVTVFPRYWAEALRDPATDSDKNETVSALEAFRYAERKTSTFFTTQQRLATEHALLEDTGKGEGTKDPQSSNGEGLLAAAFPVLRLGSNAAAARDPAKLKLLAKKEDLEQQIDRLKYEKAAVPPDQYKRQLTALLLELARTQEALDK